MTQNNAPRLRFKEFSDEWEKKALNHVSIINPKSNTLPDQFVYIDLESVDKGILTKETRWRLKDAPSRAQRLLECGDIIFQMVRPYQQNNLFFDKKGNDYVASTGYAQLRTNENPQFLYQSLHLESFVDEVINRCTGTSYPAINTSSLETIQISIPSLPEQTQIASFLSSVDSKLTLLITKKDALIQYKKGVMQQIFNQKIRFKDEDGSDYPDWEEKMLGEVMYPVTRKISKPTKKFLSIGIRSHCKGTFQKLDFDPASISMDTLFVVQERDLIVNITFAWEGAIAIVQKQDTGGLVSHRFPTYLFNKEQCIPEFFKFVFVQKRFIQLLELISPGGAGRNRVMNKSKFLEAHWIFPSLPEQTKIASFLTSLDDKISAMDQQIEKVKDWKKGLLQEMFV